MHTPLVSIALCTFNSGSYLILLLESLLTQTYKNIEIVCCDDKSTDDTPAILMAFQQLNPEIIKLHFNDTNIGYTKNFEQSLLLCKGSFIAIADHDDIWMKNKIEKLMDAIGDALLIYCDSIYIDDEGRELDYRLSTKFNLHDKPDPRSFAFASSVWGHTVLLNRELLNFALPVPDKAPYDTWLAYVASSVSEVRYLPEPLTYWRQHSSSHSAIYYDRKDKNINQKYSDWQKKMYWLKAMKDFPGNKQVVFLDKLYNLYAMRKLRSFVWPLFFFLTKNRSLLFKVWRRSYLSSLNEFRKKARGVKER